MMCSLFRGLGAGFVPVEGLAQCRIFFRQSFARVVGVALQLVGMGEIAPQRIQAADGFPQRDLGSLFLRRPLFLRQASAASDGTV